MRTLVRLCRSAAAVLAASAAVLSASATEPASDTIRLGMSTALTGPAADLGLNMRAGVQAAIDEVNASGGIDGRNIALLSLDDGYEPERTAPNMVRLINEEQVLAVIGNVGTPTAVAAIPIANREGVPFFGAFTGAGVLRKSPPDRYVINFRASYAEETAAMVDALIEHAGLAPHEIGFFTQRDSYGDAGFAGGIAALKRHGLEHENTIAHGRYERNTSAVESGLAELLEADPPVRAVIMVGAYAPCAKFVQLAREFEVGELFLNVSFVGARPMARVLGSEGDGVIFTQVVPHYETDLPIIEAYRNALPSDQEPSFGSLEGYIAARILFQAIDTLDGDVSRDAVVDALESLGAFDIGMGTTLTLGTEDHQASSNVWPTILRGGDVVPFAWEELSGPEATAAVSEED